MRELISKKIAVLTAGDEYYDIIIPAKCTVPVGYYMPVIYMSYIPSGWYALHNLVDTEKEAIQIAYDKGTLMGAV